MKAVRYDTFEGPLSLVDVPDPTPTPDGVVVRVGASGLCRSDWPRSAVNRAAVS
jgi:alcohol dehydrogenase